MNETRRNGGNYNDMTSECFHTFRQVKNVRLNGKSNESMIKDISDKMCLNWSSFFLNRAIAQNARDFFNC